MCSRRPFQGMKPDHQHIKSVKKNAKTFNAWFNCVLDVIFHRNAAAQKHMSLFPNASSRLEHDLHVFAKEIPTTNRNGPSNCHLPAEVRQSWQVLSSCVKTGQHAEQRLTLSSDERLKTTRDWKPLFCDHAGQPQPISLTWHLVPCLHD